MKPVLKILSLFVALTLLTACNSKPPLSVNQMVNLLFDIYRFDATLSQLDYPISENQKIQYYNSIFAKHNTTKEEYDEALKWYAAHPAEWTMVYDRLEQKGIEYAELVQNRELPELKNRKQTIQTTDTFDMWTSRENMYWYDDLVCDIDTQRIASTRDGSRYFVGTQRLELTCRMRGVSKEGIENVHTQIVLHYMRRDCDTFAVDVPCDSLWHRVRISTGRLKGNVSQLDLKVIDKSMLPKLSSFEYENLTLLNIYDKRKEHVEPGLIDDIRYSRAVRHDKQTSCNAKRGN